MHIKSWWPSQRFTWQRTATNERYLPVWTDRSRSTRPGYYCTTAGWTIKNVALYFCPYLHQLMTDFQNSFTDWLCGQFAIMWVLYIPPHCKCISTLLCETWMKYAYIMITNKHFGKIEKKHFRSTLRWMICIALDCAGLTQISVIRIIHCNVGLKCFFPFT